MQTSIDSGRRAANAVRITFLALVFALFTACAASATEVTFRYRPDPGVVSVNVAGYFNEWSMSASPLEDADGDGLWEGTFDLAPGRHPYKIVLDGSEWITDGSAPEFEDDGFGGKNSVLLVADLPLVVDGVPAAVDPGDGEVVARDTAVRFRFRPPDEAAIVSVAGTFNDWSTSAAPLADADRDGVFETVFRLAPGRYQYKFVVDGTQWFTDETAAAFEDDGFGGQNSVLEVGRVALVAGESIGGVVAPPLGPIVTFRFAPDGKANAVSVTGSFDGWNAAAHPMMDLDRDGVWEVRFRLPAGEHTYQFVIDGREWVADPENDFQEDDGFGGRRARFSLADENRVVGIGS